MGDTRRKQPAARRSRPATTPEGRENQMIALAVDLTEKQLRDGTATAQQITHYLRLGSSREQLEKRRLEKENELLNARVEQLASAKKVEELYETALNAMRAYSGQDPIELDYDEYED